MLIREMGVRERHFGNSVENGFVESETSRPIENLDDLAFDGGL